MGLDVGEFGTDNSCICLRYGYYVQNLITWNGVNVLETADKASKIAQQSEATQIFVDANGVGAGVQPRLKENRINNTHRVMVQSVSKKRIASDNFKCEFGLLRDELWWSVREWLQNDPNASIPPDKELIDELLAATYKEIYGKIKICDKDEFRKKLKRSPNKADALCLTFAPQTSHTYIQFDTWRLR